MGQYFNIDKSFIPLLIPLVGIFLMLGGHLVKLDSLSDEVREIRQVQTEYIITKRDVEELKIDVQKLEGIVDVIRFSDSSKYMTKEEH